MNRILRALAVAALLIPGAAQSEPRISYVPRHDLGLPPKADVKSVEVSSEKPARVFVALGQWVGQGDPNTSHDVLIELAAKKAAELGADFVWLAKIEEKERRQGSSGGGISFRGIGVASGGGGDTRDIPRLSAVFGVYTKAASGITFDEEQATKRRLVVSGFRSASKAQEAGIRVGDEVLEFEGMRVNDLRRERAQAGWVPGQVVKCFIKRGDATLTVELPLIAND